MRFVNTGRQVASRAITRRYQRTPTERTRMIAYQRVVVAWRLLYQGNEPAYFPRLPFWQRRCDDDALSYNDTLRISNRAPVGKSPPPLISPRKVRVEVSPRFRIKLLLGDRRRDAIKYPKSDGGNACRLTAGVKPGDFVNRSFRRCILML